MNYKYIKIILILSLSLPLCLRAQTPNQQQQDKKLQENIDEQIDRYTELLKLEPWQVFYVDSILNHDFKAMQAEMMSLNSSRVSNTDLYQFVQDKWMEKIYSSFRKVLNDGQWARFLKTGGSKDKKARDKRAEKRNR